MYWADEMVPKRENGQAANRRLTRYIMLASLFHYATHTVHVHAGPDSRVRSRPGPIHLLRLIMK